MNALKSQKGSVLLISLIITFVLLIMGTSVLAALNSESQMVAQTELVAKATYLAQTGIEHGLYLVENTPDGEEPAFPANTVMVYQEGNTSFEYQITKYGSQIESVGKITENGNVKKEVRIKAVWDDTGAVEIIK